MNPREDLIRHRMERAAQTLDDARILLEAGRTMSAVNRIYYAMFYAVNALLLTKDLSSARHSGVKSLFNAHFAKTGNTSTEDARFYAHMFDFRQKSDYGDFASFEKEMVAEWIGKADGFLTRIGALIEREI